MAVFMLMDVVLILLLRRMASTLVSTWAELNPGHSHWLWPTRRVLLVCLNRPACGSSIRAYMLKYTRFDYCAQYCYKDPTDCEVCTRPYQLPWTPHEPRHAAATGLLMLNSHCGHYTLHKMIYKLKRHTQTKHENTDSYKPKNVTHRCTI